MARVPQTESHAGKPRTQANSADDTAGLRARFSKFIGNLGPGLISGASDDDPSGISTYSMAGASFGYGMLWTALFSFPLIAAMQLMSARLGTVKGKGLGALVRECYPCWVLWGTCILLVIASLANASADLAGMAEATQLATGTRAAIWTVIYTGVITALMFGASYRRISNIFRWLTLVLFAYVITAFLGGFDWKAAVHATLLPHLEFSKDSLAMFVGIMGTTISPFLFFWQATQEVEEKNAARTGFSRRAGSISANLRQARLDVGVGMFISNAIMYFIILTAAATLHAHGKTHIQTAREAAEALRPLAGSGAYWLFTLGLIGTGMLAIPALVGSSAYAVSEAAQWRGSLEKPPWRAWHFYGFIAASMAAALALDFTGIGAVRMLFWAAILNGVLSPPVILLVVLLSGNPRVMGKRTNPAGLRWLGWTTFAVMSAASIGLFFTL